MKLTSASGSEINLEALYQICPSCFTEVKDEKTGELAHKINFSTLRELLGDNAFEGADEEYGFNWVGKNAARREAARVITKTLRPCPEESVDWENTQNLYIEGDNLEVLKLLQKSYLGKIKMIYIDPPYNTGNDFVYRDDFAMDKDGYDRAAGDVDEMGNRFRKNADTNARFHSDWCSMIYERLLVARSLLSNDGVIFISIDDNEVENLRRICDEIFGESNYIAQIAWRRTENQPNIGYFARVKEYILLYSKTPNFSLGRLPLTEKAKAEYRYSDAKGLFRRSILLHKTRGRKFYPKVTKLGNTLNGPWMVSEEEFDRMDANDEIYWTENGDGQPYGKIYLSESKGQIPNDFWGIEYGTNQRGSLEVEKLFESRYFDFPKPVSLLSNITMLGADKNALILDFFSGSATTAHALMQLNAEDGGNRKFIMVQLPEETETGSEAYKAGYKNICEIGKERIRRAGKKIKEEGGLQTQNLDVGFRVFKCEDSFMNDVYFSPAELKQEDLFSQVENIKDGTSDLSMLFGCMLDWGVQLSLPLSDFTVSGKKVYNVNDGDLVACFAEDVNEDVISAIAELSPLRVVFRDSCFKEAAFKMNLFELFKQKCGWSEEQVKSRVHVI